MPPGAGVGDKEGIRAYIKPQVGLPTAARGEAVLPFPPRMVKEVATLGWDDPRKALFDPDVDSGRTLRVLDPNTSLEYIK